jgi:hypothetical protein
MSLQTSSVDPYPSAITRNAAIYAYYTLPSLLNDDMLGQNNCRFCAMYDPGYSTAHGDSNHVPRATPLAHTMIL